MDVQNIFDLTFIAHKIQNLLNSLTVLSSRVSEVLQ